MRQHTTEEHRERGDPGDYFNHAFNVAHRLTVPR
jgi:hypothetical protein